MACASSSFWSVAYIYMRLYRWVHSGILVQVLSYVLQDRLSLWCIQALSLDSTIVKVHPNGCGARKKGPQAIGRRLGGWISKIDMVAASCRDALVWSLTPGQAGDGPEGRHLIEALGVQGSPIYLLMDSACGGDDLRAASLERNLLPVVPAHPLRKLPWPLGKQRYRQRNEVERLFRRIKTYRRVLRATTNSTPSTSPLSLRL